MDQTWYSTGHDRGTYGVFCEGLGSLGDDRGRPAGLHSKHSDKLAHKEDCTGTSWGSHIWRVRGT